MKTPLQQIVFGGLVALALTPATARADETDSQIPTAYLRADGGYSVYKSSLVPPVTELDRSGW